MKTFIEIIDFKILRIIVVVIFCTQLWRGRGDLAV